MNDTAEVTQIKAEHKQALARIEADHEREMALLDGQSLAKMPLPLRLIFDDRLRAKIERAAIEMSEAEGFTREHLIGKPAACKVVLVRSIGWNLDPYSVAAATYQLPDGRVGFEGVLYRAIAESSGLIVGEFEYEWYGEWDRLPRPSFKMAERTVRRKNHKGEWYDKKIETPEPLWQYWGDVEHGLGVKVSAKIAATGETKSIDFDLVDAYPRNATTWPTRPKLQIINPATRAFVTLVKPSLLMGVHFRDTPEDAREMRDITPADEQPPRRQPSAPPEWRTLYSIHGEECPVAPGEVEQWVRNQLEGATSDQIDALIENNNHDGWIAEIVQRLMKRAGPPTPRDPIPQTAPGRPRTSEEPERHQGSGGAGSPASGHETGNYRLTNTTMPAAPAGRPEPSSVVVLGKTYERLGAARTALLKAIAQRPSDQLGSLIGDVSTLSQALRAEGRVEFADEIEQRFNERAQPAPGPAREARQEPAATPAPEPVRYHPETGEVEDDGTGIEQQIAEDSEDMINRGEPEQEVMPDPPQHDTTDKTAAGAAPSAPADGPTFKLFGLGGTSIGAYDADRWLDEIEQKRRVASSDTVRANWIKANLVVMSQIKAARPDLESEIDDLRAQAS